jgi:RNA polymerase sigma-70 factor (ECF subfamily)
MKNPDDNDLVERYLKGDAVAFEQLYQRYRQPVFNYIHRQVVSSAVAEDIFQDVWLRVIRSIAQFEVGRSFRAWVFQIAHYRLIDHWRAHKHPADDSELDNLDSRVDVEHSTFVRDCIERFMTLLERLNPDQRDAFVMQQETGFSLEQIADVMGTGRETIKSRLRYAMQFLKKGLEGCND